ncbi:dehydration-responsive element-binding protein 1D-like [Prosopis cineraria]|uniref:dehydration-responsive element-binding protein 1D-like n=1 Tax=Prosopis cineraria TaxID=364024 RepID=UPI00240EAF24|nr:dehydration-responsive element-binding protein 1D-like [Prosopis cineraria]
MMNKKRRAGRKKFQETRHPTYKGVRQRNGKWVCELRQPNNNKARLWLGTFANPDMAAVAHDVAALAFKGDSASLNFPDAAPSLPRLNPLTSSLRSIQFAAMEAAGKFLCGDDAGKNISALSSTCNLECSEALEEEGDAEARSMYWDEEEVFNMPELMNSMAEGLIMTPPALQRGFNWDDIETTTDLTLWED